MELAPAEQGHVKALALHSKPPTPPGRRPLLGLLRQVSGKSNIVLFNFEVTQPQKLVTVGSKFIVNAEIEPLDLTTHLTLITQSLT